jgi:ribosome-associated protein
MTTAETHQQTRLLVQAAVAACEDKKGEDTRILELDPIDSGLSDFFLVTSATNTRQTIAIADEIEIRLKKEFGVYPNSAEGRRLGEWILLDYVDFVVHVFQAERRAFYDIERLRKSARPFTPEEFDAQLKADLATKTLAVRKKASAKPKKATAPAKAKPAAKKSAKAAAPAAKKPAAKKVVAKAAPKKATAKPVVKKASATKAAVKKTAVKKASPKKVVASKAAPKKVAPKKAIAAKATVKKVPAKKTVAKKAVVKKAVAKKPVATKAAPRKPAAKSAAKKAPAKKRTGK